jgi:hypothetical protein
MLDDEDIIRRQRRTAGVRHREPIGPVICLYPYDANETLQTLQTLTRRSGSGGGLGLTGRVPLP